MNLSQFLEATGMPLTKVARLAGVNYGHLNNCKQGKAALGRRLGSTSRASSSRSMSAARAQK